MDFSRIAILKPLVAACLALGAISAQAPEDAVTRGKLFTEIDRIVKGLSDITGLKAKSKVGSEMIDRAHLKQFLERRIADEVKPEEIRAEETTLKKFGFLPKDYDLRASTVELLTEQAAAFYDFKKKKLFVLDASSSQLQRSALVHELAHALADQHFHLGKFMQHSGSSDDASTARLAVMEGQASWLMAEYMARQAGQTLKNNQAMLELLTGGDVGAGQFPVFDKAPLYLRETLLFPYTKGMLFQNAVIERMGQEGFSGVFRNPPVTTQQILHPGKYFSQERPSEPAVPALPAALKRWRELAAGTMGELDHSILLRQYAGKEKAETLAPLWKGARYRVAEREKGGPSALQYVSEWETPEAARDFFAAYKLVLKGKWTSFEAIREERDLLAGRGDDGEFAVWLDGRRVSSLEGLPVQTQP